jgi:dTDP-4-dehydrorhamnose 3,5-epimerase
MIFSESKLKGVFIIDPELREDPRGFFARTFCVQEFEAVGLNPNIVQCSTSFNRRKGTLRGLHYQELPHAEVKLVRCTRGSVYDVIVDLRPQSSTFREWIGVGLDADNRRSVYIPEGCAHGFLTLEDSSEVNYQMSEFYHQESARGVRWNDPAFQIDWPGEMTVISERDSTYPDVAR